MSIGEAINFCIEKAPMTVSEHEQLAKRGQCAYYSIDEIINNKTE